jgi:membrane fusion protein, adhesin transport system
MNFLNRIKHFSSLRLQQRTLSFEELRDQKLLRVIGFVVLLVFVWALFAPIDRIVRAEGRVIAAGRAQIIQHLEGGIVQEILVREGQRVEAGQVLMRLSNIQANAEVQQGVTSLQSLKARLARLKAEADGAAVINFDSDVAEAQRELERSAFRERAQRMHSEQSVFRQQVLQRQSELAEAQSRARNLATEQELARKQSAMLEGLVKKGAASQLELLESQGRTERLTSAYSESLASIPRLQAAIGEGTSRVNESSSKFRAEARSELAQLNAEIQKIALSVGGTSDRLARTEVTASVAGFINRLNFNTIGGVVKGGEPLLEITPNQGPLSVEARVRPDDRASLRPGLSTRVMIGAYDYAIYGALDGKLAEVSSDTVPDENGIRYYRVVIEAAQATGNLASQVILPGMTARADVVLGQRTVMSYLTSPIFKFFSQTMREPT